MQSSTCRGAPLRRILLLAVAWETQNLLWLCQGQGKMLIPTVPFLGKIGCPLQSWDWGDELSHCCFSGSFYNIHLWKQLLFAGIITRIFLHLSVIIRKLKDCLGSKITFKQFTAAFLLRVFRKTTETKCICDGCSPATKVEEQKLSAWGDR